MPKPKPILKRKEKSGKLWKCSSVLHKQCARIVEKIIESDQTRSKGVTLKSLTLAKEIKSKKATHAVVCETLRFLPVIQDILHRCGVEECLKKCIGVGGIYVLIYELLFGQSFPPDGKAECKIHSYEKVLKSNLEEHMNLKQIKDPLELVPKRQPTRPIFARVNTLKITLYSALESCKDASPEVIEWLPDVLKFPPGTQLHDHVLVRNGLLFLQGFGSLLVAHALHPAPNWKVIDACAAPGHKTIHLASLLPPPGRILALDRNQSRIKRLNENIALSGATNIQSKKMDFLSMDPNDAEYRDVDGMILDPSCSGSGTTHTRMDDLLPSSYGSQEDSNLVKDEKRIERLAAFQVKILRHGLSFPKLKRLVYSTCSIYEEENERVVQAVLEKAKKLKFELKLVLPQWKRRGHPLFKGCENMIRINPQEDATDGFFIAVFERQD